MRRKKEKGEKGEKDGEKMEDTLERKGKSGAVRRSEETWKDDVKTCLFEDEEVCP